MALRYTQRGYLARFTIIVTLLVITSCNGGGGSNSGGGNTTPPLSDLGDARLIENYTGVASEPQIAMDGTGTAIAVWQQYDGTRQSIWANRFNGAAWGTADLIEADNTSNASDPQIAMDATGRAIAVWIQYDSTRDSIWANRFDGVAWGTAELIEMDNVSNADIPQIGMDGNGSAIAVWRQSDGTSESIWANHYDGTTWSAAELISNNIGIAGYPQIAMDDTGSAIAVWSQTDGNPPSSLWANRFDGAAWGTAELIETDDAGGASNSQIAMDGTGSAIAVWIQYDGSIGSNVWANHFDGANWGVAELIETNISSNPDDLQLAMDDTGNAIAVWRQSAGNPETILWANRFDGAAWSTARGIQTESVRNPQIAMDGTGSAIAVWKQLGFSGVSLWAKNYNGTGWSAAEQIETENADSIDNINNPRVAMDGTGTAIAVWEQTDGSQMNIWAYGFE